MTKYAFDKGDIVAMFPSNRKGVVMSIGKMGGTVTALVRWFDGDAHDHIDVQFLKKTLRAIDGGKDHDT